MNGTVAGWITRPILSCGRDYLMGRRHLVHEGEKYMHNTPCGLVQVRSLQGPISHEDEVAIPVCRVCCKAVGAVSDAD